MKSILLIVVFGFSFLTGFSQKSDTVSYWKKHFDVRGYVKYLDSFSGDTSLNFSSQSLIHNRINLKYYPTSSSTFYLEVRNRLFYEKISDLNPFLITALNFDNGVVDLSWAGGNPESIVWNSKIDRLWYKGFHKSLEWSIGRQRINWGINSFWNSNDLFNAFNFTDFDYEERPGSDAVRIQKFFKNESSLEAAFAAYQGNNYVGALKYAWNKWEYDFQLIGSRYFNDYSLGFGWAGNIKNLGFKGEASYFHPEKNFIDTNGVASVSVSVEYLLKKGKFLGFGALYNSAGVSSTSQLNANLLAFQTSAKFLMPTRWSTMVVFGGKINDLSNFNIVTIYTPGVNLFLIMPSYTYSLSQSVDLSVFLIDFATIYNGQFVNGANAFARLKYSF